MTAQQSEDTNAEQNRKQIIMEICVPLADAFLGTQDHGPALFNVVDFVARYQTGDLPDGQAGARRRTIQAAAKHAIGLSRALQQIDLKVLAQAIGHRPGSEPSQLPLHIAEIDGLRQQLELIGVALKRLESEQTVRHQRPALPDPILFGVEALVGLWRKAHGVRPTRSYKARGFGDFALRVLGPNLLGFPEASVREAVRQVLSRHR